MASSDPDLLAPVAAYYSAKVARHGATARGVDWNGEDSQALRFRQLCRIIDAPGGFSVNDLGCGYGALYDHLARQAAPFSYSGFDISESMLDAARERHRGASAARFVLASTPDQVAEYGSASGIFNVRLDRGDDAWRSYIETTLDALDRTSSRGFAFNCLTAYSDADRMRPDLYYADPGAVFDRCMRRYSRHVALLHDYGLYEFTILVRKLP